MQVSLPNLVIAIAFKLVHGELRMRAGWSKHAQFAWALRQLFPWYSCTGIGCKMYFTYYW